jgi:hypothetical protein
MREFETDRLVVEFLEKQGVIKHIDLNCEEVVESLTGSTTQPSLSTAAYSQTSTIDSPPPNLVPSQKSVQKLDRDLVLSQFIKTNKLAHRAEILKPQSVNIEADIAPSVQVKLKKVSFKKSSLSHSPAKNIRLFYATGSAEHSENIHRIIKAVNKQEIERASNLTDTDLWQKNISMFTSYSENEVALMHRFVKDRTHFFDNNKMLSAQEIILILGYGAGNPRRTVSELISQNKLIAFKQDGRFLAPEFQFNIKATLYPELEPIIACAKDKGVSHLELAMWLSRSRRFVLGYQRKTRDWSGQAFTDALQAIEDYTTVQTFDGKPIDALAKGDKPLFDILVKQWLAPQAHETIAGTIVNE